MSLYGMMRTSASGMAAQANRLAAISDNVSNSNTTGYKEASIEFSTLVLDSGVSDYAPGAVESHTLHHVSQQGAFTYTTSPTDLALKGDGFFLVKAPDGQTLMTRAGSFVKDGSGNLVNAAGFTLLGYNTVAGKAGTVANGTAGLVPVNLNAVALKATPSTTGTMTVNVPSNSSVVSSGNLPSTNSASSTYTAKSSLVTYDNLGNQVVLDAFWSNTGSDNWELSVYNHSNAAAGGGFPYSSGPLSSKTLAFDPANGNLLNPASTGSVSIAIPNGSNFTLDVSNSTQLASNYAEVNLAANGNAPSAVNSVQVSATGDVSAVLQNGSLIPAFQIPVARVVSPDNLQVVSGNAFMTTKDSGAILIGTAGNAGNATVVSSALEQSTVDQATELTNMIQAQSSYTANSKVFQAGADLVAVLNNLHSN